MGDGRAERDEVRVGVTWSDQGWCWLDSRFIYGPLQVWVAEVNAAGGLAVGDQGRRLPVRLVQHDDASSPPVGVEAVRRLIEDDRVDVLCSSGSSEIHAEVIGLSEAAGIVHLNVGAPDPALFPGTHFHLQCGPHLHGYYASRPAFWAHHDLRRVAFLYADFAGWNAVGVGLREQLGAYGLEEALWVGVPRQQRWSTQYGPYPEDFDDWGGVLATITDARPDAVVVALPSPAEYRLMQAMRAQGVWFPYLEMMYGASLSKIGFGPEDLLFQFHGGRGTPVDPSTITVGGTLEELAAKGERFLPGVPMGYGRSYVGPAVWAHLVEAAGTLDGEAVMAQAHAESGTIVTMEGRLTWTADGDIAAGEAIGGREVLQVQRHPFSADLGSVRVWPEGPGSVPPVLTRQPYGARPDPWRGSW